MIQDIKKFFFENKLFIFGIIIVIGGGLYWGIKDDLNTQESLSIAQYGTIQKGDVVLNVSGTGQVFAQNQVDLRPQVAGDGIEIAQVLVNNNQEVKKNDVIAVLDTEDAQKEVRDAELALWSSQIKMDQTTDIYETLTVEDRRNRQLQEVNLLDNKHRLADSKEKLQDYYIRAPFDGIVTDLSVKPGDSISRDEVLASVVSSKMYAQVALNEVDAVSVQVGNKAKLSFDAFSEEEIEGSVSRIDTIGSAEQGVVYFYVEIAMESFPNMLKPGMSVSAEIIAQSKEDVLTIPVSAIRTDRDGEYAYKARTSQGEEYDRVSIQTGISDGIVTEILSGVSLGDRVVTKLPEIEQTVKSSTSSQGILDGAVRVPGSSMSR